MIELQSLASSDFAKGLSTVNIDVSLKLDSMLCSYGVGESSTSGDNSSNSYGSSCASGSGTSSEIVPIKELRSRLWAFNLKHVGQTFVDANDFRLKVLQYSVETGVIDDCNIYVVAICCGRIESATFIFAIVIDSATFMLRSVVVIESATFMLQL
ncbi:hypothetical protein IFM89_019664 [Coptis chinensis]|uniref:Uncharacterized protein n=1 Tax=Coptis chinensis TaxID=261450 RepID=A0A835I3U3_9MAGN|nr:hypothetical protein IFM89_019664 [Coptis chinensis]